MLLAMTVQAHESAMELLSSEWALEHAAAGSKQGLLSLRLTCT